MKIKKFIKNPTIICIILLCILFSTEIIAIKYFEKDTVIFNTLMSIVVLCAFIFVLCLQKAWQNPKGKN